MIGRARHLRDDWLFECYLADRGSQPLDPRHAEHLADCEACSARYADLVSFLSELRAQADAEADAVFSAEQLHQQQEQILRRIEHLNRSARVISFPGHVNRQIGAGGSRVGARWLAAAAAAGLFVGVAVGSTLLQPGLNRAIPGMRVASSPSTAPRIAPTPAVRINNPAIVTDSIDDDAFLLELEFALQRPHTRELQPFDALTPHVREISAER